ncbi:MAG: hypothetical protein NXH97_21010 [Rhodobacteraceae bacterium]|nr:hypothetical protein [Paracoccaceae bacterium]
MNPDVHCITVVHGSRDAELKNLGLRGDSRFTEQYRINPIDRAGGAADFYIRTPVLSGFRDRSDQSLADFLKVRGFRREPYFFAEFEVEFNEDLTDITQSRGARNYRLKPLEAVVVGGRNAPVGWYPVVTLSLDSPNGAASETWAFDLKPVMERYSAARLGAEGPGDRFPEVRMVMTSSPIGTPMFRKLPALGSDEAALFKRYNTLVAIDQAYELSKKKKKEADDDAKEEKEEKCKFSKLPYEPGPGKPDDDPTGSKNHRSQYYEYILRSDPSVVEVRGEIAKAKAEGKGDVVKALEAQREELIKAKWEALEIQRLVARGAAQTECDEVENVEPDEKGTAAAEGKPLTPSEKAEMERIEAIFASGVQFSEVTASVVWTKEPNQFLINLGKAVSAKAAETATALSSALLQTEAAQLQEDIEASLSDTSIETEALTAVADYLAAVEAAQLDPTNEALIVKAEAALRAASGKCEVASLSGISVSRCSLPFTPPL